jgi:hypothetical protein
MLIEGLHKIRNKIRLQTVWGALLFLFLLPTVGFSQTGPKVDAEVDTLAIKIGEQIQYKITVEADSTDVVFFPEGQTFSPLETVEAIMADTLKNNDKVILQKNIFPNAI